jgi:NAD(P)-dependent dehydrogenase (short-subunit alcohol dehydrogenase family)
MQQGKREKTTAIITGASSGIGKALYNGLALHFDEMVGVGRTGPDICIDVRDARQYFTTAKWPIRCNLLINCAGIMPFEESREVFDVNFWGAYEMIQVLHERNLFTKDACIINIASISGIVNDAELPIYSASKAALISLTKSLAKAFAPDIRVNCISPGLFYPTKLAPGEPPQALIDKAPLKCFGNPEELVEVALTIYRTKYMTGANVVVDGGASC